MFHRLSGLLRMRRVAKPTANDVAAATRRNRGAWHIWPHLRVLSCTLPAHAVHCSHPLPHVRDILPRLQRPEHRLGTAMTRASRRYGPSGAISTGDLGKLGKSGAAIERRRGTRVARAGEIVAITATGQYKVGSWFDKWIDPRGYPGGDAQSYNFDNEPFKSAPHGSGLAMVGVGDGKAGHNVAPCTRFVSRGSGPLVLGINDSDPRNNTGTAQFTVHVQPPSATEWLGAQTASCQGQ